MKQLKRIKTLAILGSPHNSGITAQMLDSAIEACSKRNDEITVCKLYDKNIGFCRGCKGCYKNHGCVMENDDIKDITKIIKESDFIILAAPTYFANVPGIVKNFFDRLLGVAMEETKTFPKPRMIGKKYMLLTACNTPFPFSTICKQSSGALRAMNEFFKTSGAKKIGSVVCTNTSKITKISSKIKNRIQRKIK